jgi:hypothetical protein
MVPQQLVKQHLVERCLAEIPKTMFGQNVCLVKQRLVERHLGKQHLVE